jgi:hypothetical protein
LDAQLKNRWGALRAGAGAPGPRATPWSPILRALLLVNLILFCSAAAVRHQPPTSDPVFQKLDAIVKTISEITGFEQKHAVPYGRMNHEQLRKFLAKRLKATLRPEELHADELSLKLFGLVPQDFDLKKSTVDLLTEQAAAFYDYQEKRLFILDTSSLSEEEITLAHELSHALADQHFNMEKFMEEEPANDDENLAHSAVVEGQATWLMMAYQMKKVGLTPAPTPEMLAQAADNTEASNSQYPVLDKSPIYIQRSLLFPYDEGTLFFDAVYRKLGFEPDHASGSILRAPARHQTAASRVEAEGQEQGGGLGNGGRIRPLHASVSIRQQGRGGPASAASKGRSVQNPRGWPRQAAASRICFRMGLARSSSGFLRRLSEGSAR